MVGFAVELGQGAVVLAADRVHECSAVVEHYRGEHVASVFRHEHDVGMFAYLWNPDYLPTSTVL